MYFLGFSEGCFIERVVKFSLVWKVAVGFKAIQWELEEDVKLL